ncbi:hypothetical protein pb186bvf_010181 [Paramecium bursaria]
MQLKIDFLQTEIQQLTEQLKLQEEINIKYQKVISAKQDKLIQVCNKELQMLKIQTNKLLEQRNELQSKCLLLEQILQASEDEKREILQDSQQLFQQNKQQQVEQQQPDTLNEGLIVQIKQVQVLQIFQVTNVNEVSIKLHQEIDKLNKSLIKVQRNANSLREQNQDLIRLNFTLSNEICRLKLSQMDSLSGTRAEDPQKYIQKLAELQQHIIDDQELGSWEACPYDSPLSRKVFHKKQNIYYQKEGELQNGFPKYELVPKIDLKRAQQIQTYTLENMALKSQQLQNLNHTEELARWMNEYKLLKNRYEAQLILNKQLELKSDELRLQYQECVAYNDILIKSNNNYEQKLSSLQRQQQQYKNFYLKYKDNNDFGLTSAQHSLSKLRDNSRNEGDLLIMQIQSRDDSVLQRRQTFSGQTYKEKFYNLTQNVFSYFKKTKIKQPEIDDEMDLSQLQQIKRQIPNRVDTKSTKPSFVSQIINH